MRGFFLSILLLSLPVQAQPRTLHVSLSGAGGDGTTGGKAFCSIAAGTAELGAGDGGSAQFFQDAANLASGDALDVSLGHGPSQSAFAADPLLERRGIGVDITTDLGDGELSPGNSEEEDGQPRELAELGGDDFPINDPEGNGIEVSIFGLPSLLWNYRSNNYLVVWKGFGDVAGQTYEKIIFGQILTATGERKVIQDIKISDIERFFIVEPSVAWNSTNNQYLSVWSQDFYRVIHGQILTATGAEIGPDDFPVEENIGLDSLGAVAVWNSIQGEYLVVWASRNPYAGYSVIYCRRCSADGQPLGDEPTLVSEVPDPFSYSNTAGASHPAVVWNASDNEYLVVWEGWNQDFGMVESDRWIFAQLLNHDGEKVNYNFRLSAGWKTHLGEIPDITWNATSNQYFVVFKKHPKSGQGPYEVVGRQQGVDFEEIPISHGDIEGSTDFDAFEPALTWNDTLKEYLVVWSSDQSSRGELEIYGKRLSGEGVPLSSSLRISDMGPDGSDEYGAYDPDLAWNNIDNEYLVVWTGDDNSGDRVDNEFHISGQRLGYVPSTGPSQTPTPTPILDFDIAPNGGDGRIDSIDLLMFLGEMREDFRSANMFQFSNHWLGMSENSLSTFLKSINLRSPRPTPNLDELEIYREE